MEQFFKTLTELIKKSNYILIETHANPDFDGLGSAIALQQFINRIGIENYIIVNKALSQLYDQYRIVNITIIDLSIGLFCVGISILIQKYWNRLNSNK